MADNGEFTGKVALVTGGGSGIGETVATTLAALVVFLASGEASFITGSYHLVDGGYTAQ